MPRRVLVLLLFLAAVGAVPIPTAQAALPTTTGQTTYYPLDPTRVMDTRNGTGVRAGTVGPGQWVDLPIPDPIPGAQAAVLNVTAVAGAVGTVVRVYPPTASPPSISNLNVAPRATAANLVVTKLGGGATVRFYNGFGNTHLVADLAGFYVQGGQGDGFFGTSPKRLLDTRTTGTPLQGGVPRTLPLGPAVPADATAVVLNITAVQPTSTTVLSVYPGGSPPPVSNLNATAGSTVANLAVVRVDEQADTVTLLSTRGSTHVVVDLAGWYVDGSGAVFHPVTPFRVLDTRSTSAVVAGNPRSLVLAGATTIPWAATAMALNVTAVAPTADTFVTVYPLQSEAPSPPVASNLNLRRGQTVPNAAVVATGEGGAVRLANRSGSVNLVVDVSGWFSSAGDGWDISWPQCTSAGATTSHHPTGGAFAVIGLTHGVFTPNTCFNNEWAWARTLGAPPSAYLNVDANVNNTHWGDPGPRAAACGAKQVSVDCGFNYGWNLAGYAAGRALRTLDGGRAFLWLDVEGPYSSGPFWTANQSVNRTVIAAAIQRLRQEGHRVGIYSERASSPFPDWDAITGGWIRGDVQNWAFRAIAADAPSVCSAAESFSGGPVVMEQISTTQSGEIYDVNHLC